MSNLIVSMVRFSSALTLYSLEQVEKSVNLLDGGAEISKTIEGFEKTLNSITDVLTNQIDAKKKEALESLTKISEDTVSRAMEGMDIIDPRQAVKATTEVLQKTSDVGAKWVSEAASAVEKATASTSSGDGKAEPESKPVAN